MINFDDIKGVDWRSGRFVIASLRPIQLCSPEVYDAFRSAIGNRSEEQLSAFRVLTMTPALERLAELVRQAEAKTRARKIEGEAQHAAEQFRAAELRARRAVEQLRQFGPPTCGPWSRPMPTSNYSKTWCASWPCTSHRWGRKPMRSG